MQLQNARPILAGLLSAIVSMVACDAVVAGDSENPFGPDSLLLSEKDIHEDCRALEAGEVIHFSFQASEALDFNLHFHDAGLVYTPVELSSVDKHEGRFQAETAQTYCLMWTGLSPQDTWLEYRVD